MWTIGAIHLLPCPLDQNTAIKCGKIRFKCLFFLKFPISAFQEPTLLSSHCYRGHLHAPQCLQHLWNMQWYWRKASQVLSCPMDVNLLITQMDALTITLSQKKMLWRTLMLWTWSTSCALEFKAEKGWWRTEQVAQGGVDAPSLQAFKARLDVALGSLVCWLVTLHTAGGWNSIIIVVLFSPGRSMILRFQSDERNSFAGWQ